MSNLRYLTAGESHGKGLTALMEGVPANLEITAEYINNELARRQMGYGRGGRMKIETDTVEILSGIRFGKTLGSPVALFIENRDWENWQHVMIPSPPAPLPLGEGGQRPGEGKFSHVTRPRPGHADLSGAIKYNQRDIRNILERSSARETAARVAVGAVAKRLLEEFGIRIYSWVTAIGNVSGQWSVASGQKEPPKVGWALPTSSIYYSSLIARCSSLEELYKKAEGSDVRCPDAEATEAIKQRIDEARNSGDSLGGVFEIVVSGVPVGLGSHVQWDRKLNARLAMALMSIQAIKGVEFGLGFEAATRPGSEVHDEIFYKISPDPSLLKRGKSYPPLEKGDKGGFYRKTNHAGGIEGGMSNGGDIVIRAAMKPIPTLYQPLKSVDIETKEIFEASIERSDICAVPAASVVGEAVVAIEIANAMIDKFGGDSLEEMKRNYDGYIEYVRGF
ncbi:MAG: chorismate synthase [Deltaproteobacteria bacterium]|nr:chorismate synthase [Deltaproteobacteria bacterium]